MVKFNCKFTFNNTNKMLSNRNLEPYGQGQKFVDKEAIRIMTPFTPKDSSALIISATKLTRIGSGLIRQGGKTAPYGRKLYRQKARFQGAPMRGNYWFDRSMKNGGSKIILQGLRKVVKK